MTDCGRKPYRWANDLNIILNAIGGDHFPIPVGQLAKDFSAQRFPGDCIVDVMGRSLGKFEGALYPVPQRQGWAIIYNSDVSIGRRRFTIAHEFGHFLMHRQLLPEGIECDENAVTFRDGLDLEAEADTFAATLLMPFDDFRRQLDADTVPDLETLSELAARYGVSLISCVLRWLEYTHRRSMIVISRDGFVLWSRSSKPALVTRRFFRTRNSPPIEVPAASLVGRRDLSEIAREGVEHPAGVWLPEPCTEFTIHADRYDQAITILHFGRHDTVWHQFDEPEEDTFDRFSAKARSRFE